MSEHDLFSRVTDGLLREAICELRRSNELAQKNERLLERILHAVEPNFPTSLHIQESSMIPLAPGQSPQFTATLVPAGSDLGGVAPTWTSSDTANAPVGVDATGLIATVALSAAIAVGASVTLSITATSTDGNQTATGAVTFTVVAAAVAFPTSFDVAQSA